LSLDACHDTVNELAVLRFSVNQVGMVGAAVSPLCVCGGAAAVVGAVVVVGGAVLVGGAVVVVQGSVATVRSFFCERLPAASNASTAIE
jgi:uncharacterized membrane protein